MAPESHAKRLLALIGAFGFMSGLPLPLTLFTLQQWFTTYGIALHAISLTGWIGLSYTLKFLWSAVFDRHPPRVLRRFGRRRGWLLLVQPALALSCAALALTDPGRSALLTVMAAVLLAFLSASQDILIDAWRIETFAEAQQGAALAAYIWGYRGAMVVAGSGTIWLSTRVGWHVALLADAGLLMVGITVTWLAPEPVDVVVPRRLPGLPARFEAAILAPLREFLSRPRALWVLAFVLLFKLGKDYADLTAAGFYRYRLGLPPQVVAGANALSYAGTLSGSAAGGFLVARLGAWRALLLAGAAQAVSLALYLMLLAAGPDAWALTAKVVVEYFAGAMADTAFLSYLSLLCSRAFTATQYALLSSLAVTSLHLLGGFSGYAAEALGYRAFYIACIVVSLLPLLLLARLPGMSRSATPQPSPIVS